MSEFTVLDTPEDVAAAGAKAIAQALHVSVVLPVPDRRAGVRPSVVQCGFAPGIFGGEGLGGRTGVVIAAVAAAVDRQPGQAAVVGAALPGLAPERDVVGPATGCRSGFREAFG